MSSRSRNALHLKEDMVLETEYNIYKFAAVLEPNSVFEKVEIS